MYITGATVVGAAVVGFGVTGAIVVGSNVTGAAVVGLNVSGAAVVGFDVTGAAVVGLYVGSGDIGASVGGAFVGAGGQGPHISILGSKKASKPGNDVQSDVPGGIIDPSKSQNSLCSPRLQLIEYSCLSQGCT